MFPSAFSNSTTLLAGLLLLAASSLSAQSNLKERIDSVLESSSVNAKGFVGVHVVDADSGEELYSRFADQLFTPASNAKIYSSAAALDTFGPDHQFETYVGIDGKLDDGRLDGNLYLIGRGDPTMKTKDLEKLAKAVQDYGISEITGDLIVDVSLFEDTLKGPGWMWDDNPDTYSMSISALMLNYNVATAQIIKTDGGGIVTAFDPPSDYPKFEWSDESDTPIRINREPFRSTFTITGSSFPNNRSRVTRTLAVYDPPMWVGHTFKRMLMARYIGFTNGYGSENQDALNNMLSEVIVAPSPNSIEIIIKQPSLPMSDILPLFNKPSENAIGEMLWHHLALNEGSYPASWSSGKAAMNNWLTSKVGLSQNAVRLEDGSGLTRYNLITPRTTSTVLKYMWESDHREVFMDSLPIIGVDGTLSGRGGDSKNSIIAKTGTMSGVSTLSGYARDSNDEWKIFSILVNGYVGSSAPARKLQDQICAELIVADQVAKEESKPKPAPEKTTNAVKEIEVKKVETESIKPIETKKESTNRQEEAMMAISELKELKMEDAAEALTLTDDDLSSSAK